MDNGNKTPASFNNNRSWIHEITVLGDGGWWLTLQGTAKKTSGWDPDFASGFCGSAQYSQTAINCIQRDYTWNRGPQDRLFCPFLGQTPNWKDSSGFVQAVDLHFQNYLMWPNLSHETVGNVQWPIVRPDWRLGKSDRNNRYWSELAVIRDCEFN